MKRILMAGLLLTSSTPPALAAEPGASPLIGTWRVISTVSRTLGVEGETRSATSGYIVITPEHRIVAVTVQPGRVPATNDTEALALARSMMVYTGRFELAADHYTVHVEFSSTQLNLDKPQVRHYRIDGDTLTVTTPMHESNVQPGTQNQTVLTAVREK